MACMLMAYIVMSCMVIAYVVMAHIVIVYVGMAYKDIVFIWVVELQTSARYAGQYSHLAIAT